VFTLPQIAFYTYLGATGRAILLNNGTLPFNPWLIGLAAIVVMAIVGLVSRRIRVILIAKAAALPAVSAGTPRSATS
jgi:hypothetical protein